MLLNIRKPNNPIKKWAKTFVQRRHTDGQETLEKMFNICNHQKEMQIKTTVRICLTPVRMAIIKDTINNKCWGGCGEKGTLLGRTINWYMCAQSLSHV